MMGASTHSMDCAADNSVTIFVDLPYIDSFHSNTQDRNMETQTKVMLPLNCAGRLFR
jgi:hypothetical protein